MHTRFVIVLVFVGSGLLCLNSSDFSSKTQLCSVKLTICRADWFMHNIKLNW